MSVLRVAMEAAFCAYHSGGIFACKFKAIQDIWVIVPDILVCINKNRINTIFFRQLHAFIQA